MVYYAKPYQRNIFFEGDSLSEFAGGNINLGRRMTSTAFSNLTGTRPAYHSFAFSGSQIQTGAAISITNRISNITSIAKKGDIAVIWAGTNDLSVGLRTAAQVYADLCSWATTLSGYGMLIVAVTTVAKDRTGDDATAINTSRLSYNSLIKGNSSFTFNAIADPAALTQFDAVADASNTTYYNADKVHLTDTGYDSVATEVSNAIQTLL